MDTPALVAASAPRLSLWERVVVWLRLLLLQGSWNFETLQGQGVLFALWPTLRRHCAPRHLRKAVQGYLGYFNTNPFLAPALVGALLRLEEDRWCEQEGMGLEPRQFADMVMAPYAAVGDAFFWGGLRPLLVAVVLLPALWGWIWSPLLFVLLFAAARLTVGIVGFHQGYRLGLASVQALQRWRLSDAAIWAKRGTVFLLGGVAAWILAALVQQAQAAHAWSLAAFPAGMLGAWLLRRRWRIELVFWLLALLLVGAHEVMKGR